jgi:hypothetical protein
LTDTPSASLLLPDRDPDGFGPFAHAAFDANMRLGWPNSTREDDDISMPSAAETPPPTGLRAPEPPSVPAMNSATVDLRSTRLLYLFILFPLLLGCYMAIHFSSVNPAPGETGLAAISLATKGTIADPYLIPTGPTAHVSPIHVGLLATVYKLFGPNTASSRIVLSLLCVVAYCGGAAATLHFTRSLELGLPAQITALALTCVLPFQLYIAVIPLRQWDQPFGALILMGSLLVSADPLLSSRRRFIPEVMLAVLVGLAGLVSPSAIPTVLLALMYTLRQRHRQRDYRPGLLAAAIVAAMLSPWALRNKIELGRFILTRSNFGLELLIGNGPGATAHSDSAVELHPHDSLQSAQRLASIGEAAYMAEMMAKAKAMILEHPADFIQLTMARLYFSLVPDRAMVDWDPLFDTIAAGILTIGFALLRLGSLLLVTVLRQRSFLWLVHCFLPLAPYVVTHVNTRYEFLIFFTSACLICTGVDLCQRLIRNARSAA